jgi:hypothetical protein
MFRVSEQDESGQSAMLHRRCEAARRGSEGAEGLTK